MERGGMNKSDIIQLVFSIAIALNLTVAICLIERRTSTMSQRIDNLWEYARTLEECVALLMTHQRPLSGQGQSQTTAGNEITQPTGTKEST